MAKILFTIIFVGSVLSAVTAQLADGKYKINCNTKGGWLMAWKPYFAMKAWNPAGFTVALGNPQTEYDILHFKLQSTGNGYYRISTDHPGKTLYAEAYPKEGTILLGAVMGYGQDQQWHLQDAGNGRFRILVNTVNMGWKAVEAYPRSSSVWLVDVNQSEADQLWFFTKV